MIFEHVSEINGLVSFQLTALSSLSASEIGVGMALDIARQTTREPNSG